MEVSGAVRPLQGSLGVKGLMLLKELINLNWNSKGKSVPLQLVLRRAVS